MENPVALVLIGLVGLILLWTGLIDPLQRIRSRRARSRGQAHDAERLGAPPRLRDGSGDDQTGAPGCALLLIVPGALATLAEPWSYLVAGAAGTMFVLWAIAHGGAVEK